MLGLTMYRQDYDERFPNAYPFGSLTTVPDSYIVTDTSVPAGNFKIHVGTKTRNYPTWMDLLYPYVKSTQLFVCSSRQEEEQVPSYGYNSAFSGIRQDRWNYNRTIAYEDYSVVESEIQRPSEIIVFADYNSQYSPRLSPKNMNTSGAQPMQIVPHLEGRNRAYAGGHVKWQPLVKFIHVNGANSSFCDIGAVSSASYYASPGSYTSYCDTEFNLWMN